MKHKKCFAASVVMNGVLMVTGGYDGSFLAATEFIYPNGTVGSGPNLPTPREGHCMVTLPDGKVMILGGYYPSLRKSVSIFNPADNSFTRGPTMRYDRGNAACTSFNSPMHSNRLVILVTGGSGQRTAEVLDYTSSDQWEQSKNPNLITDFD